MDVFLGIDTSCYTTSICYTDSQFHILADERKILDVPQGSRGLSQSNMIYQHIRNLPLLFETAAPLLAGHIVRAIAVTDRPRRRTDSYMPAFLAGLGYGRTLAAVLQVPLYTISHQENHLLAVLGNTGAIEETDPFYGIHLSGGTTELLRAVPDAQGLEITRLGGTSDISAGQFLDRIGVALGFSFPAGVSVDRTASMAKQTAAPSHVFFRDGEISFSGQESRAQRVISQKDVCKEELCSWALATVWNGLQQLMDFAVLQGMSYVVAAGGVMSNGYLRRKMTVYCRQRQIRLELAANGFSADNAAGAAFWAARQEREHI